MLKDLFFAADSFAMRAVLRSLVRSGDAGIIFFFDCETTVIYTEDTLPEGSGVC